MCTGNFYGLPYVASRLLLQTYFSFDICPLRTGFTILIGTSWKMSLDGTVPTLPSPVALLSLYLQELF